MLGLTATGHKITLCLSIRIILHNTTDLVFQSQQHTQAMPVFFNLARYDM